MNINTINTVYLPNTAQLETPVRPTVSVPTVLSTRILSQPISINLLNSFDLQTKLQKATLDNLITTNQELALQNSLSLQGSQKIPLGSILEGFSQSILAFFALDNIQQITRSEKIERTEDISRLFYNINMTNQTGLNNINASFNALLHKTTAYFSDKIRPIPYEKNKRNDKKQSAKGSGLLKKIISKLITAVFR